MTHPHDASVAHPAVPADHPTYGQHLVPAPPTHVVPTRPPAHHGGKVRSTGTCVLMVVTLGFSSLFWYHGTHSEMQRHRGSGVGGGVALLLGFFLPFTLVFIPPPLVGGIVWFVKTNGALNDYWRSVGAS